MRILQVPFHILGEFKFTKTKNSLGKWEKICLSREGVGTGFHTIHEFDLALLAKQLW